MATLRQFQQFLAVAETLSFRQAAERLNMAQPPLTTAIRQLEDDLGVRLVERTNRIIGLTAAGEVLREEAQRTLAQAERALTLTRRAGRGEIGSLRVGFVASAVRQLIPSLIAAFRTECPDVELLLEEGTSARQIAAIGEDRIDIGVVALPLPAGADAFLAVQSIVSSRLIAAIPGRHPLAAAPSMALVDLAEQPWILFPAGEGPGLHSAILRACAEVGFTPRVAQHAVQMETIVGLVAAGLGVTLVPHLFSRFPRDAVAFKELSGVGSPIPYELALVWRHDRSLPALNVFIRIARDMLNVDEC